MPAGRRDPSAASNRIRIALSPHGSVRLEPDPDGPPLPEKVARDLSLAFATGPAHGLLVLGAARLPGALPPSLAFWRRLGHDVVLRRRRVRAGEDQPNPLPPPDDLKALLRTAPPLVGGEYLDADVLARLWRETSDALDAAAAATDGGLAAFLAGLDPAWHQVGRVCFHLAENKKSERTPFAFLATYAPRIAASGRVQHQPLAQALREFAGEPEQLLALLAPVQRAAEHSHLVAELVREQAIYRAQPFTAETAYRFLQDAKAIEDAGVVVRLPDWWNPDRRRRARVTAQVSLGPRPDAVAAVGFDAMLDFQVDVALDGEPLTAAEWRALATEAGSLRLVRGRWVEVDAEKVQEALAHWGRLRARAPDGLSFADGMRLLAGVRLDGDGTTEDDTWTNVVPDRRLGELLDAIRDPARVADAHPGEELRAELRPYQELGLRWLWRLHQIGLGACLADDMGLGKTLQVIALLLRARQVDPDGGPNLVVVPASLLANWSAELLRFAPSLTVLVAHPSALGPGATGKLSARQIAQHDVVLTTYGTLLRHAWPAQCTWRSVVLDEAQAIKNPGARQTRAVKALASRSRIALTGTPVENRPTDLWSIFDFLCPGLLGSLAGFRRYQKRLADTGHAPLRELVRPYILRRLKSDKRVIADLPDKTEVHAYCSLTARQAALYQQAVGELQELLATEADAISRRGAVLAFLMRFKQICNHPSQWLGDGGFAPDDSGKFGRLRELCDELAARQERVLVFTQFRQMVEPLAAFLATCFGRPGLVLHGGTAVRKRRDLVEDFARDDGPPFFVLSLKAGGTGLNLTAASHVVHFDRWWNPAVENQATDRAYRIGQHRNVLVHKFVCRGTIEERIDELIAAKRALSDEILGGGGEIPLTELHDEELIRLVSLDIDKALGE